MTRDIYERSANLIMTDNIKVISRPKVRFYQFSDNERNKEKIVQHCEEQAVSQASGPRIKEIVSLKKPVKVIDPIEFTNICDKDISLSNCNIDTLSHFNTIPGNIRNESSLNKNMPKVEDTTILRDANGIPNTKKSCSKLSPLDKSLQGNILKDRVKSLQEKGKENKGIPLKRTISNKNISKTRTGNSQHVQSVMREKFKLSTNNSSKQKVNVMDFKKLKMTKSQSVPSIMKKTKNPIIHEKILGAKLVTSDVTLHSKTVAKNKIFPVKKIILRNISGPKIKTSVASGIFRKKQDDAKASDANERGMVTLDVTVKDLAQPDYNSIVCTINKLKELEQQKIVTDISHLPSALKSFLNGKVNLCINWPCVCVCVYIDIFIYLLIYIYIHLVKEKVYEN